MSRLFSQIEVDEGPLDGCYCWANMGEDLEVSCYTWKEHPLGKIPVSSLAAHPTGLCERHVRELLSK